MQATTFKTSIGTVGLIWEGAFIERVLLPEANTAALKAKLKEYNAEETCELPRFIKASIALLSRHLETGTEDLSSIVQQLNLTEIPDFHKKVYRVLAKVPAGKLVTYKKLAESVKSPLAMRAVGQAMAKNRFPLVIPCHRVVQTSGALGNFSAHDGVELKARLLRLEGAPFRSV